MTDTPRLEVIHVTRRYGDAGPFVLDDVSLTVNAGESLAIVGPSGCGKSTLLNIIGTLDRPTSGNVLLNGSDVTQLDDAALATVRNREVGFIFQEHHLLPQCSAMENVLIPALGGKGVTGAVRQRASDLLNRVGLSERKDHLPGAMSGGERQRVAVVRALINEPSLLLADEPTGSLDRASADALAQLLIELNRERNISLIVVTHAPSLAAHMQQVVALSDGKLAPAEATS